MKLIKKFIAAVSAAAVVMTASVVPLVPVQSVITAEAATLKLNKKSITIEEGKTFKLKVKGAGKKKVKWSSSDTDVVTVSKSGRITGEGEGAATVKAKVGKKTLKCKVTVTPEDKEEEEENNQDNNSSGDDNSGDQKNNDEKEPEVVLSEIQKNKNELLNTIKTEGFYNKAGHWAMTFNAGKMTTPVVQYLESEDALEFSFMDITDSVITLCSFKLPMKEDNPIITLDESVSNTSFDVDGTLTVNASNIYFNDSNSAMSFNATLKKGTVTSSRQQELLNSAGNFAFVVWDSLVEIYAKSSFSKIGLTSLTTSGAKSPSELAVYDDSTPFGKLWNYIDTNGTLNSDGHKSVKVDFNDGYHTTGIVEIMAYEDTHTIEIENGFYFEDGDNKAMGIMVFDLDKNGDSAGIVVDYQDITRGNGYHAVTTNFDPGSYFNRSTTLYFRITSNTTNFSDYKESSFTSKSIVPNCLEDDEIALRKIGFSLNDLGFTYFTSLK